MAIWDTEEGSVAWTVGIVLWTHRSKIVEIEEGVVASYCNGSCMNKQGDGKRSGFVFMIELLLLSIEIEAALEDSVFLGVVFE